MLANRAKLLIALATLAMATPAAAVTAPTTSADLETLALQLEQSAPSSTLNTKLLTLLREPAKTLEGRTLPTSAAQYTTSIETAWKLLPAGFIPAVWVHPTPPTCTAMISLWQTGGLKTETFAWGTGVCAAVTSAAIARGWAWKLRQVGR